ncbi:MAG: hypothetical protein QGG40_12550 [Myxococcota bacterium]|nr:hypothetical protein [Myxococcota bacterium]
MNRALLPIGSSLLVVCACLGWLALQRPDNEPPMWVFQAVLPWIVGTGLATLAGMTWLVPRTLPDRWDRIIRATALLVAIVSVGEAVWVSYARSQVAPLSSNITQSAPQYGPGAEVLVSNLRNANVIVPNRPHDPSEVQTGSVSDGIQRRRSFTVSTNQRGLRVAGPAAGSDRVDEVTIPAPGLRILCLGESVSFGWGVAYEDSYPAQLSELLGVEAINAAVPSMHPPAIARWAASTAGQLDVDVILFASLPAFEAPDPVGDYVRSVQTVQRALPGVPLGVILPPLSSFVLGPATGDGGNAVTPQLTKALAPIPVLDLTPTFREGQTSYSSDSWGEVLVLMEQDPGSNPSEAVHRLVELPDRDVLAEVPRPNIGIATEMFEAFEDDEDMREPLFFDGGHPDAEGYALFARTVAEWMKEQGWVATGS